MLICIENSSLSLLKTILPAPGHGYYVAAIKDAKTKKIRHEFTRTIEALWEIEENADRDGHEPYHGCAVYKEARMDPSGTPAAQKRFGRTKNNVAYSKVFYCDIDVDDKKERAYRSKDEALAVAARFCNTLNLPSPIIVSSGSGLHLYWPLQQALDRETWERYATGLRNLCELHGLLDDTARTTDISSILRTPGTHNRKRSKAQLVECEPEFLKIKPYAIEEFAILLEHCEAASAKRSNVPEFLLAPPPAYLQRDKPVRLTEGLRVAYEPVSGAQIAEHCEQLRALRDNKGCIPEPLWYAGLGVLAFCEDGDELGHRWSSGYNGYTERETQERLDRARQFKPTTCTKFHSLNPKTCEACPHWVSKNFKSPIALGRQPTASQPTDPQGAPLAPAGQPLLTWELTQSGAINPKSYNNVRRALAFLEIRFKHDVFHDKKIVEGGGEAIEKLGPQLSDAICRALHETIIDHFRFDPGLERIREIAERACEANRFNPVSDYLDSRQWDGQPRLDRWMITYMGAEDTELNRMIGKLSLVAAVRRVRKPGTKFDQIIVLESPEGENKSTAIELMAGKENFSDQTILGLNDERQQERLRGIWLYEIADLTGMKKAEVDQVKAFASRLCDRARGAYARYVTEQPRSCVLFATTNESTYLKSQTGNRRFWSVKVGRIDIEALKRDRDQLWGEAAQVEASGASLVLPEHLWGAARAEQEKRREQDPWDDLLANVKGKQYPTAGGLEERITSMELLGVWLRLEPGKISDREAKRLGYCMRRLGWEGPKTMRIGSRPEKGYSRPIAVTAPLGDPGG